MTVSVFAVNAALNQLRQEDKERQEQDRSRDEG